MDKHNECTVRPQTVWVPSQIGSVETKKNPKTKQNKKNHPHNRLTQNPFSLSSNMEIGCHTACFIYPPLNPFELL